MFAPAGTPSAPMRAPALAPERSRADAMIARARAFADELVAEARGLDAADARAALTRAADALIAASLSIFDRGGTALLGMDTTTHLRLSARLTYTEAQARVRAAAVLERLPRATTLLRSGALSWSQVRAICAAVRHVRPSQLASIDAVVSQVAPEALDPEDVLTAVDAEVARVRPDVALREEDRIFDRAFLQVQGRLDGSGTLYGVLDPDSLATVVSAIDAAVPPASHTDDRDDAPGRRALDGLVTACEGFLSGGGTPRQRTRPRPRLIATIDLDRDPYLQSATVLWGIAGRRPALSAVSTQMLLCDAEIVPVLFRQGRPAATADAVRTIPDKLRTALIARDRGCTFPGCRAPVAGPMHTTSCLPTKAGPPTSPTARCCAGATIDGCTATAGPSRWAHVGPCGTRGTA